MLHSLTGDVIWTHCDLPELNDDCGACTAKSKCSFCNGIVRNMNGEQVEGKGNTGIRHCVRDVTKYRCTSKRGFVTGKGTDTCDYDPCTRQGQCGDCLEVDGCMFCHQGFYSHEGDRTNRCISAETAAGETRCGSDGKGVKAQYDDREDIAVPENSDGIHDGYSYEKAVAVGMRVAKTGYVVGLAVAAFTGASILAGPAAPIIMGSVALVFFLYSQKEKRHQKQLKDLFAFLIALQKEIDGVYGPCQVSQVALTMRSMEGMHTTLKLLDDQRKAVWELDDIHHGGGTKSFQQSRDARNAYLEHRRQATSAENDVIGPSRKFRFSASNVLSSESGMDYRPHVPGGQEHTMSKADRVVEKIDEVQSTINGNIKKACHVVRMIYDNLNELSEVVQGKHLQVQAWLNEVGPHIFGGEWENKLALWDGAIATMSLTTSAFELGTGGAADMVDNVASGGSDTAEGLGAFGKGAYKLASSGRKIYRAGAAAKTLLSAEVRKAYEDVESRLKEEGENYYGNSLESIAKAPFESFEEYCDPADFEFLSDALRQ